MLDFDTNIQKYMSTGCPKISRDYTTVLLHSHTCAGWVVFKGIDYRKTVEIIENKNNNQKKTQPNAERLQARREKPLNILFILIY